MPSVLRARRPWFFSLDARPAATPDGPASPAHVLTGSVLPRLRNRIEESAKAAGFEFVDTADAFVGRGWCGEKRSRVAQMPLPWTMDEVAKRITGQTPSNWRPFASRNRLVRTANDSYFTQLSIRSGDVNGTMHPTAEGHMVLAGYVYDRLQPAFAVPEDAELSAHSASGSLTP